MQLNIVDQTSPWTDELAVELTVVGERPPCVVEDPELWFSESPDGVEQAKALCQGCPLRQDCLVGALERQEPWGVWGGELFVNGVVVPRKRPRGRPRKDAQVA